MRCNAVYIYKYFVRETDDLNIYTHDIVIIMLVKNPTEQGASEVVGYILIVGLSLVLSVTIVIGFQGYISTVSEATNETNEQRAIVQFNTELSDIVANTSSVSSQIQLQSREPLTIQKSSIELSRASGGTETTVFNKSYDSILYTGDSGTIIAENGGVWNIQETESTLLSKPEIRYPNSKLNLSTISSSNNSQITPGFTTITKQSQQLTTFSEPYDSDQYILTINSPAYRGWGKYMNNKYNDGVQVTYTDSESTVEITLNPSKIFKKTPNGVIESSGEVSVTENSTVTGTIKTTNSLSGTTPETTILEDRYTQFYPIDSAVNSKLTEIESNSPSEPSPGSGTVTAGQYYIDSTLSLSDTTYDTSSGDIEIAVSGDLEIDNGSTVSVTGGTGNVEFFVGGDVKLETPNSRASINSSSAASRMQIFAEGDTISLSNVEYNGIIYNSPNKTSSDSVKDTSEGSLCSQFQSCIKSSIVSGSIITGDLYITDSGVSYDTSVESTVFDFTGDRTNTDFEYTLKEYTVDY